MSQSSIHLLPSCVQCSTVQGEGIWSTDLGVTVKAIQKLKVCSRCFLTAYCSDECRIKDWSEHQFECIDLKGVLSSSQADKIAKEHSVYRPKTIAIDINNQTKTFQVLLLQERAIDGKLSIEVKLDQKRVSHRTYLFCRRVDFDWRAKLKAIQNPLDSMYDINAYITLGLEMVERGIYSDAFNMIAHQGPSDHEFLKTQFAPRAIGLMHKHGINIESIIFYAAMLGIDEKITKQMLGLSLLTEINFTKKDTIFYDLESFTSYVPHKPGSNSPKKPRSNGTQEAIVGKHQYNSTPKSRNSSLSTLQDEVVPGINQTLKVTCIPDALQAKIFQAQVLPLIERDFTIMNLAQDLLYLFFYDEAFALVSNWVTIDVAKLSFLELASEKMIRRGIVHGKIIELARTIHLSDDQILSKIIGHYALVDYKFACTLAQSSSNPSHYFNCIVHALLMKGRADEATSVYKIAQHWSFSLPHVG